MVWSTFVATAKLTAVVPPDAASTSVSRAVPAATPGEFGTPSVAAELPADRILVETDAPYLAPNPFRGKRNEPAFVIETAKVLADTRGVSLEEIARQTSDNFFRLFGKVPPFVSIETSPRMPRPSTSAA